MTTYLKIDGTPVSAPLTSQQQDRADGMAYASAWKARGGCAARWQDYAAAHHGAALPDDAA